MDITRIDSYDDPRFSADVLRQHGAFVTDDGVPCPVRITGLRSAVINAPDAALDAVIETFRFYAGHITEFRSPQGRLLRELPEVPLFRARLTDLQPSQFFVDEAKLAAVSVFVHGTEDVIVPVVRDGARLIACDGHTRLYAAHRLGLSEALAFLCTDADDTIFDFARMARERGVHQPADLPLLPHGEYDRRWNDFCDRYFASLA